MELAPLVSSYAAPSRRSPTAGEHAASKVSAPTPDWTRFSVTVGALGRRIVVVLDRARGGWYAAPWAVGRGVVGRTGAGVEDRSSEEITGPAGEGAGAGVDRSRDELTGGAGEGTGAGADRSREELGAGAGLGADKSSDELGGCA